MGAVSEDEKIRLMKQATVYCSPAIYGESFGVVLLEAMASGTPVVAGDNAGYACVMKGTGLLSLVNPKDSSEFSRRLEILLYDKAIRKVWMEWADTYVEQFDSNIVIDQYEAIYKNVVTKSTRKSKD